ncbi:hypothetical protein MKW94_015314 [Papaver nudicaule]|uniref:CHCH domain-containing protein n=1 Tax=Papaver nudicaule TaxID=74823 RepID=A0AA41VMH3_PAPNU|nr:hypothetical protein [Papaver nudicaule]
MEKTSGSGSSSVPPFCAHEALDLLNCVTGAGFDQEKCIRFLNALRDCVLDKKVKKFSLAEDNNAVADSDKKN